MKAHNKLRKQSEKETSDGKQRHGTPEDWPRAHCLANKHRRQTWGTEALGRAVPDRRPALAQQHPRPGSYRRM